MKKIPRIAEPDSTLSLAFEGYRFISNRCDRYENDHFSNPPRISENDLHEGTSGGKVFYDTDKFSPTRVMETIRSRAVVSVRARCS